MRHILHADLDAFYASVEQLDNPELRGKPVVVGGSPTTRGVVAAASYEARAFSVRSAMPMHTAMQRCPQAVRVSPRFGRYHEVSSQVMEIFRDTTDLIEPLSLDEAFLDVTARVGPDTTPESIAAGIRQKGRRRGRPHDLRRRCDKQVDSQDRVGHGQAGTVSPSCRPERSATSSRPSRSASSGASARRRPERLVAEGIETIGDLAEMPEDWFTAWIGKNGPQMRHLALGHDDRPVVVSRETKSVSAETTLAQDTESPNCSTSLSPA